MKIYRTAARNNFGEHLGYEFFSSKSEAEAQQRKNNKGLDNTNHEKIEEIEFELKKSGVIFLLNQWASHPDNG